MALRTEMLLNILVINIRCVGFSVSFCYFQYLGGCSNWNIIYYFGDYYETCLISCFIYLYHVKGVQTKIWITILLIDIRDVNIYFQQFEMFQMLNLIYYFGVGINLEFNSRNFQFDD